jgi:type I restriction enzyme S subunit
VSWPLVDIGDVAFINPRLPKDTDESQEVTFLGMASISEDGTILNQEQRVLSDTKKGFTYFECNDVLLAKITPCFENGKAVHLSKLNSQIGFGSTEFHVLRPHEGVLDAKYLFYMVWSKPFRFYGEHSMSGAAGQKRVSADFIKGYKIPLPFPEDSKKSIKEQKRIADILDKADGIRRKRQQAIDLADEFLRATFLDMFGDPMVNPKNSRVLPMTEVFNITTGKLNSNAAVEGGEYPFFTCAKEVFAIDNYAFDQEALLLAGNNAQAKYDVKYHNGKFNAYQRTYVLTLKDHTWSYHFFKFALEYQLQNLKRVSKGSSTKYITMDIMSRTLLPIPNEIDQYRFVSLYNQYDKTSRVSKAGLKDKRALFNSLSQKAFSGELN